MIPETFRLTRDEAEALRKILNNRESVDMVLTSCLRLYIHTQPAGIEMRHAYIVDGNRIIVDVHDLPEHFERVFVTEREGICELNFLANPAFTSPPSLDFTGVDRRHFS